MASKLLVLFNVRTGEPLQYGEPGQRAELVDTAIELWYAGVEADVRVEELTLKPRVQALLP